MIEIFLQPAFQRACSRSERRLAARAITKAIEADAAFFLANPDRQTRVRAAYRREVLAAYDGESWYIVSRRYGDQGLIQSALRWFGSEPFPLEELVADEVGANALFEALAANDAPTLSFETFRDRLRNALRAGSA